MSKDACDENQKSTQVWQPCKSKDINNERKKKMRERIGERRKKVACGIIVTNHYES